MRPTLTLLFLFLAPQAQAQLPQPRVVDVHGDVLPSGALVRLGKARFGQGLDQFALAADGKSIRCLRWGVYILTVDLRTGRITGATSLPTEPAYEKSLSQNGRWALLVRRPGGYSGPAELEVWDLDRRERTASVRAPKFHGLMVSLSQDARYVAAAGEQHRESGGRLFHVWTWEPRTGHEVGPVSVEIPTPSRSGWVSNPRFSPDGRHMLISCGCDKMGYYYCLDRDTLKVRWEKTSTGGFPLNMPDGRLLICGNGLGRAISWANGDEADIRLPLDFAPSTEIGFADGGAGFLYVAGTGKDRTLKAWEWRRGRPADGLKSIALGEHGWATSLLTEDRKEVLVSNNGWRLYDLRTGQPCWPDAPDEGHRESVADLVFSADGRRLASSAWDFTVRLWDVDTGRQIGSWKASPAGGYWDQDSGGGGSSIIEGPPALDLSGDGSRLVFAERTGEASTPRLRVLDTKTFQTVAAQTLPAMKAAAGREIAYGRVQFAGGAPTAVLTAFGDWEMRLWTDPVQVLGRWDLASDHWRELGKVRPSPPARSAMARGRWLAAGAATDTNTGRQAFELVGYGNGPLAPTTDGRLVAGIGRSTEQPDQFPLSYGTRRICVWDAQTGAPVIQLPWEPRRRPLTPAAWAAVPPLDREAVAWPRQLAMHPTGRWAATADAHGLRLWDLVSGRVAYTVPVPHRPPLERNLGSPATALAFTPDGTRLATGLPDGTILFWPVPRPKPVPPRAEELDGLWADLTGSDPAKGWRAAWRLEDDPAAAVRLVRARLKPMEPVGADDVRQWLADLDAPNFQRREAANRKLESVADRIVPAVTDALKAPGASAESRDRMKKILAAAPDDSRPLPPWAAGLSRAVAILEHSGTPDGRAVLRELAGGAPSAWLTKEAHGALDRLQLLDGTEKK